MKRLSCKAVHLSKEPSGFPDSEDVDTRGTESNIEDTNSSVQQQLSYLQEERMQEIGECLCSGQ